MQSTCQRCDSRNTEHVERLGLIHRLIKHVRHSCSHIFTKLPQAKDIFSLFLCHFSQICKFTDVCSTSCVYCTGICGTVMVIPSAEIKIPGWINSSFPLTVARLPAASAAVCHRVMCVDARNRNFAFKVSATLGAD